MPDLRVSGIVEESVVDGPGVRFVVFTQGCEHHCPGCHNSHTHALDGGTMMPTDAILARFDEDPLLSGITFSGGDPLHPANLEGVTALAAQIREEYPDKTIWLYTGSTWQEVKDLEVMQYVDVLVDGEFEEERKDTSLPWRGSANQQVIDVPETVRTGRMILHG